MDIGGWHLFDIAIIGFLLLSALVAYMRGFVRESLSLLSWIGAVVATYYLFGPVEPYVASVVPIELFAKIATAVILFVVTLLVFSVIAGRVADAVANSGQSALDRALGFLFGLFRGALLVCAAYLAVSWVIPPAEHPGWLREARTTPLIRDGAVEIERLVPPEFAAESRLAAGREAERLRGAVEAERLFDRFSAPTLTLPDRPPPEVNVGYGEQQRRDMERLIRGTQ